LSCSRLYKDYEGEEEEEEEEEQEEEEENENENENGGTLYTPVPCGTNKSCRHLTG